MNRLRRKAMRPVKESFRGERKRGSLALSHKKPFPLPSPPNESDEEKQETQSTQQMQQQKIPSEKKNNRVEEATIFRKSPSPAAADELRSSPLSCHSVLFSIKYYCYCYIQ